MMFAVALLKVLEQVSRAADGLSAVLFVYDDLGDGFSAVASLGGPIDAVVAGSDNVLGHALESRQIACEALDSGLLPEPSGLERLIGPDPALLVPLFGEYDLGVAAIRGAQSTFHTLMRDPQSLALLASTAAEGVRTTLPNAIHGCRYRRILDGRPAGVAVIEGPDCVISYANAVFRSILGMKKTPLLGRPSSRILRARIGPDLLRRVEEVRAGARVHHDPRLKVTDEYGHRYYELHLESELGVEEDATYIVLQDRTDMISMRTALEHSVGALADSQSLLSTVLDSTDNGIVLVGMDGSILYANEQLSGMFDVDARRLIASGHTTLVEHITGVIKDPDRYVRSRSYLQDHPEEKISDQIELTQPTQRVLDRYSGPVYNRDGTLFGRIEVYTDVTEVRQLQRNKDEFLSVVSHELKTPVTSIKGYAQLLGRRAVREHLQASTIISLSVIERQANRMQQLIETLLDLSRWDLGKLKFEPRHVNFSELVRHAADLAGMSSEARRIELRLPDSPVWIRGDEQRMEQVVTNLLLNAIRYSPGGEAVTVSLHEQDEVRLIVRDRGIGIPPEARLRIFERFYRGPGMTDLTGLGIGLYISKNIVEQHGGRITVESEVGAGSTFTVSLPRFRRSESEPEPTEFVPTV